jgi:DNA repair protein SbcD/Mre11
MLRFLHSSDWHLGASLEGISREPDQARFLDWLVDLVVASEVDALLVSGDIFDQPQPTAEAQRLYYGFLAELAARTQAGRLRKTIVIGGNHDSAARLSAPQELLSQMAVDVVGGYFGLPMEPSMSRLIRGRDGTVLGGVAAVPYVHEFRLGVRSSEEGEEARLASMIDAYASLYRRAYDHLRAQAGSVPTVAMGHLGCLAGVRETGTTAIHVVGTLGCLPPQVVDQGFDYVALGHIHQRRELIDHRVLYSGAPLQLSFAAPDRAPAVLLVELDEAGAIPRLEVIAVPQPRRIEVVRTSLSDLESSLARLGPALDLPTLVSVEVLLEHLHPMLVAEVGRRAEPWLSQNLMVVRVEGHTERPTAHAGVASEGGPRLEALSEEQVFELLCEARGETLDSSLRDAFRLLLVADTEQEP